MKLRVPCHTAKFNYDGDYPIVLLDDEKDAVAEMKEMLRRQHLKNTCQKREKTVKFFGRRFLYPQFYIKSRRSMLFDTSSHYKTNKSPYSFLTIFKRFVMLYIQGCVDPYSFKIQQENQSFISFFYRINSFIITLQEACNVNRKDNKSYKRRAR